MSSTDTQVMTLASLRTMARLTQKQVATRMGVSQPRVSQIEWDYPNVKFAVVQQYVQALGGQIEFGMLAEANVQARDIAADPRPSRDHGDRTKVRSA